MKRALAAIIILFILAGCEESTADFWNPERCNNALETTLRHFDEYKVKIEDSRKKYDEFARMGMTEQADAYKKSIESFRENGIGSGLKYIDVDLANCDKSLWTAEQNKRIDDARAFLNGKEETATAEGMPKLVVTSIQSEFVPYELSDTGSCSGPFLNLIFTVTNQGDDFPRPVDIQLTEERSQEPLDTTLYFTMNADLDYGDQIGRVQLTKTRQDFAGGVIKSGETVEMKEKIRVQSNEQQVQISASAIPGGFLKSASAESYETNFQFPIWDIYTESNATVEKYEEKPPYILTKTTIINKGTTPTPGPVVGDFYINDKNGRKIAAWSAKTDGPVSGTSDMYSEAIYIDGKLPDPISVYSNINVLCPDGSFGNLSDGDTTGNIRTMEQK